MILYFYNAHISWLWHTLCFFCYVVLLSFSVIRLSSPNLNLVIGSGAIILYIDIIVSTLPIVGETPQTAICMVSIYSGCSYKSCEIDCIIVFLR